MEDDEPEPVGNQIVLHEDKKYYASAMEVCIIFHFFSDSVFSDAIFCSNRCTVRMWRLLCKRRMLNL